MVKRDHSRQSQMRGKKVSTAISTGECFLTHRPSGPSLYSRPWAGPLAPAWPRRSRDPHSSRCAMTPRDRLSAVCVGAVFQGAHRRSEARGRFPRGRHGRQRPRVRVRFLSSPILERRLFRRAEKQSIQATGQTPDSHHPPCGQKRPPHIRFCT